MSKISRRDFFGCTAALGGTALLASSPLLSSCTAKTPKNLPLRTPDQYYIPTLEDKAADGREIKAGLIGCGGRFRRCV